MITGIVISDFKSAMEKIKYFFYLQKSSIRMGLAIRLADMKQRAFNKQFHILLVDLPNGEKLISVDNRDIDRFKRKRWLPKNQSMLELRKSIFYSTPLSRNNKSTRDERRAAKDKYVKYMRRLLK